jgi:SAM-dependent methyltransferase
VSVKNLVRPIPGARRLPLLRQRLRFTGTASYWERRYVTGGTSGAGSYGEFGAAKAEFLSTFVSEHRVRSVVEFGCGDGHVLSLAEYPSYVGLDVSRTAIEMCKRRFAGDPAKSFFLYDGSCFVDRGGVFAADLALSLDVIYHLIENPVFETYMSHLFAAGQRYVVVYGTNEELPDDAPHVQHRRFSSWVEANHPQWRLAQVTRGPLLADFFVYERSGGDAARPSAGTPDAAPAGQRESKPPDQGAASEQGRD